MKFETWFKAQYGNHPLKGTKYYHDDFSLDKDHEDANRLYHQLTNLREEVRLYDIRWDGAYKSWTCNDKYKKQRKP